MGKKKIIQKSEEELLREKEQVEASIRKEFQGEEKKKGRMTEGNIYISSSYNNTIITLADNSGNVIAWQVRAILVIKEQKRGRLTRRQK